MRAKLKSFIPILEFLEGLSSTEKKSYLRAAPIPLIQFIADLCYNVLSGNVVLSDAIIEKLRPFRKHLEAICVKGISLKARKKVLQRKKFFSNVISPLIPILLELVK